MKIKVRKMIDDYFDENRTAAAEAAGVSLQFLNNWVSNDREVLRLDNGDFILVTKTQKVFKRQR